MGNKNWMTSDGLDIDMQPFSNKEAGIKVSWGDLLGDFVSYESKKNILTMKIFEKKGAFKAVQDAPLEAKILFTEEIYIIGWKSYNYTIRNDVDGLLISIEEKQNEQ
jgi:hypothetical protein|tara:strand:- start:1873 stop:2193 length:321 start_codon:yes stop_codon:yes gene_type:complete